MVKDKEKHWYIGYVRSCQEKRVAEALQAAGETCYLPMRKEKRKWSDRVKTVDVLLLKGLIFIQTYESRRATLLSAIFGLCAFMFDKATHQPAVVPEAQMQAFMFMVDKSQAPVQLTTEHFSPGDRVRVVSGNMEGMEGELVRIGKRNRLLLRLNAEINATVDIDVAEVEKIPSDEIAKDTETT
ncbi:MAG: UpxY family transcription antiterminator [Bacteroidales bacterium]|nr:UpxY family transcription antiterminator [Bacteroidales bacterium]